MAKTDPLAGEPANQTDHIEAIAKLAREAAGLEIAELNLDVKGLPKQVPIAKQRMPKPKPPPGPITRPASVQHWRVSDGRPGKRHRTRYHRSQGDL